MVEATEELFKPACRCALLHFLRSNLTQFHIFFIFVGLTTRSSSTTQPSVWCREVDAWAPFASSSPYRLVFPVRRRPIPCTIFKIRIHTTVLRGSFHFYSFIFPPLARALTFIGDPEWVGLAWKAVGKCLWNWAAHASKRDNICGFLLNVANSQMRSHPL